jgi:hypothetical protein
MSTNSRGQFPRYVAGGLIGGVVGAIVAVNFVIFSGLERGYETTIPEIFRENAIVGVMTVAILAAGPVLGVLMAHRMRGQGPA